MNYYRDFSFFQKSITTKNKTLKIIAPHLHFGQENKLDIPVNVLGLTPSQIEFFELSYEAKMLSLPLAVNSRLFILPVIWEILISGKLVCRF